MCLVLDQFLWGHSSRVCDISCFKQILNHFIYSRNEHVEMNNFSCSLSCTWMTIIDYFMLSAILSTFIKLPFVIKISDLSILKWPLKTGFTVYVVHILL